MTTDRAHTGSWRPRPRSRWPSVRSIGGLFTTYLSWRWVFAGEVLMVVVILVLARRMADGPQEPGVKLDLVGTALSALGLGLIVFGDPAIGHVGARQAQGRARPQWIGLSPAIWLLLGGGVVLWLFFLWENRLLARGREPLVDPGDPARAGAARRSDLVLLPVLPAGRPVLRRAAVPVGRARTVGDRHGRPAAAAVDHAAAGRGRHPQVLSPTRRPAGWCGSVSSRCSPASS